ncbi:universal stress protein [Actinomadura sp. GC306]|uniref:universal stress protein n=1 Tax=Actinomadura sp. GC306 TaxID=2530367 RepID=UPI001FB644EE|nr:universal stress protein [Actinomadura sp. GC306]
MSEAIVVGTDGSAESERAVEWAAAEAVLRKRPLHLVHALERPVLPQLFGGKDEELAQAGEALLETVRDGVRVRWPELETTTALVADEPAKALAEQSEEAFELVLGSRGRGGFASMLLGSTSRRMASQSTVPVVIVRGEATAGGEVVVGIDLSWESDRVLDYAFEAAALHGARLRVVHAWVVYGMPVEASWVIDEAAVNRDLRAQVVAACAPLRERYPQVEVVEDVSMDHPVTALSEASRGARLAVVGARRRHWDTLRLGSTTHGAVHHAECPVAVVPHD